jgi:ATP-dependent DNA helicase RecQ
LAKLNFASFITPSEMPAKRSSPAPKGRARKKSDSGNKDRVLSVARKSFGFDALRPGQEPAIDALLDHQDCLVVMPTGSGKSAIYQVAGMMMDGATVVISPLIALQKDQVDSINESGAAEAVAINSTQRGQEARVAVEKIEDGDGKFIFLAPEQLHRPETIELLEQAHVSLFVVDEAHCISEWGHDFRPSYLIIGPAIERLGHPAVLAMTATASPQVREEIQKRLGLRDPKVIVQGFDRPNISLRVDHFQTVDEKLEALVRRVDWADKPGIVYVATRKNAETVAHELCEKGVNAAVYHAGLKADERSAIQERFMNGETDVIVATNAFGMGIDKADIRFVYHFDISESLDNYYQEIGRAGRDGEKAEAILFFRPQDIGIRKFQSGEGKIGVDEIEKVAEAIASENHPIDTEVLAEETDLSERKLAKVIHRLEDVGSLEVLPTGEVQMDGKVNTVEAAELAAEEAKRHQEQKREKIRYMQEYADISGCRREHLLRYFGDSYEPPCGNCDRCEETGPRDVKDIPVDPSVGTRREVA